MLDVIENLLSELSIPINIELIIINILYGKIILDTEITNS